MITTFDRPDAACRWLREQGARALQCDSRRVRPGDAFVAWPGAAQDGRRHVAAALAAGAVACLVERAGCETFGLNDPSQPLDPRIAAFQGLKAAIGAIKSPKSVAFVAELPLSAVGKVLRRKVQDKYWEGCERRIG